MQQFINFFKKKKILIWKLSIHVLFSINDFILHNIINWKLYNIYYLFSPLISLKDVVHLQYLGVCFVFKSII